MILFFDGNTFLYKIRAVFYHIFVRKGRNMPKFICCSCTKAYFRGDDLPELF